VIQMTRCENCKNALIGRSRTVHHISSSERLVSDWNIISIDCKWNHETSIYGEIDCQDWERGSDGRE
jgi:hypothetical protein